MDSLEMEDSHLNKDEYDPLSDFRDFLSSAWSDPEKISTYFSQEYFSPLYSLLNYFAIVLIGTWISKKIAMMRYNDYQWRLAVTDFFVWHQMGLFAFGEAEIFKNYGYIAMFTTIVITSLLTILINGKLSHFFLVHEEYVNDHISSNDDGYMLLGYILGPTLSAFTKSTLLKIVSYYKEGEIVHECLLPNFLNNYPVFFLISFFGTFLFRIILVEFDSVFDTKRIYFLPLVYASFSTLSLYIIGIAGFDLGIGISRILNCMTQGSDILNVLGYIVGHSLPPYLGWALHTRMTPLPRSLRSPWGQTVHDELFKFAMAQEAREAEEALARENERGRSRNRRQGGRR